MTRVPRSTEPAEGVPHTGVSDGHAPTPKADAMAGEGDEFWERLLRAAPYHGTVEKLRDAADVPGWRQIEAARAAAAELNGRAARSIPADAGKLRGRDCRQVNVKLAEVDFELLCNLAVSEDVAPSTMARMLLRRALAKAAAGD